MTAMEILYILLGGFGGILLASLALCVFTYVREAVHYRDFLWLPRQAMSKWKRQHCNYYH